MFQTARNGGRYAGASRLGAVFRALAALALVALVGQAHCIWGSDRDYLASQRADPLQVTGTYPEPDQEGVSRTGRLVLRLSDRVRPGSLEEDGLRLLQGAVEVEAATKVDLIECEVSLEAASPLEPETEYTLEAEGLVGFGGGGLEEIFSLSFVTGQDATAVQDATPPTFSEVFSTVLMDRCAACHQGPYSPAGLDLSDPELAEDGLLGGSSIYAEGAPRYVVSGNHAASYLMHKVLGLPGIWGDPMPLGGDWPLDRACGSSDPELRLLADWIDGL